MKNGPYILIVAPVGYPGFKYREKYIYEHHAVYWSMTGKLVPKNYILHHLNHDRHDNRFENLELMSALEHCQQHGLERSQNALLQASCFHCKKSFSGKRSQIMDRLRKNNGRIYCTRSCQISLQQKNRWSGVP